MSLSTDKLFDIIAPINSYKSHSNSFEPKAQTTFNELIKELSDPLVIEIFGQDISLLRQSPLCDVKYDVFGRAYNKLFARLVLGRFPDFEESYGKEGERCFKQNGNIVIIGEKFGYYPFFSSYYQFDSFLKRL